MKQPNQRDEKTLDVESVLQYGNYIKTHCIVYGLENIKTPSLCNVFLYGAQGVINLAQNRES